MNDFNILTVSSKNSKNSKNNQYKLFSRGGVILPLSLVYEPIGSYFYCYNLNGTKNVTKAVKKIVCKYCNKSSYFENKIKHFSCQQTTYNDDKTTTKCDYESNIKYNELKWCINFGDFDIEFKDEPLDKVIFQVPDDDLINLWLKNEVPEHTNKEIFEMIYNFFKITIDVVEEYHLLNPTLAVLQSWFQHLLDQVFYIGFEAKWGGGKTKALEGWSSVSYHGLLIGDVSQSAMVRLLEQQGLSIAVDELDVLSNKRGEDNPLLKSFRQGYRKGNKFVRVNPNNYSEFDLVDGFGSKAYTFVNDVEGALQQRTLITSLRPTKDYKLPIIDIYIRNYGKNLFEKVWCWYMSSKNLSSERGAFLPFLPFLPHSAGVLDKNEARTKLYNQIIKGFTKEERTFLERFTGRNSELSFNIIILSKILDINILDKIKYCFIEKEESDKGFNDNILMDLFKKTLVDLWNTQQTNYTLDKGKFRGCFFYSKNYVYEKYRSELKAKEYRAIDNSKFKKFLKEFGFLNNVNIKRQVFDGHNVLCLIFDNVVLKELELKQEEELIGGS